MSIDKVESLAITSVIVVLLLGVMAMKIFKRTDAYSSTFALYSCNQVNNDGNFILELKKQIRDEFIVSPLFHNVSDNLKNNDFFNISYETIFKEVSRDSYLWRQNKHKTYTKQPLKFLLFEKNDLVLLALNSELDFKEGKAKHKFTCTEIQKKDLVIKE